MFDEYDDEVQTAEAAESTQPVESDAELRPFVSRNDTGLLEAADSESGGDRTPREGVSEWTLRKSCAQTLDHLSHEFPDKLLEFVLPVVDRYLHVRSSLTPAPRPCLCGLIFRAFRTLHSR